ncbi:hypothetical protein EHS25_010064 [Saitozyma podzolica]|uniref:Major facilitator superfamily (MFS) profile domain-containing protein n=1 Tax=Saitozyma podzolica TaxID=1890683 RepID=A0A427YIH5_9TREE|nr:hypothetical protein EHS25_010064 [Saitozyma podzolica]
MSTTPASESLEKVSEIQSSLPQLEAGNEGGETEGLSSVRLWVLRPFMGSGLGHGRSLVHTFNICGTGFLLPVIEADLNSSSGQVEWVNSAFNITWGCFALVAGRMGDIYGLRSAYLLGITFCTVWIAISGFMPNIIGLGFARALAGAGFAVASPAAAGIVGASFPQGRPKNMTFAAIAGAGAIGAGLGWLTGGVLADATRYKWRLFPWIVAAGSLYPLIVGFFTIPKNRPHPVDRKIDWLGAAAITASQITFNLGLTLSVSNPDGWKAPYIPPLLVVGVLLLAVFAWRQMYLDRRDGRGTTPPPLTPRRLFAKGHSVLLAIYASAIFVWAAGDNLAVIGAYYYDQVLLLDGWESGTRIAPGFLGGFLASVSITRRCKPTVYLDFVGVTLARLPAKAVLLICDLLFLPSGIFIATKAVEGSYWRADLWAWLLIGFATDGTNTVANVIISNVTDPYILLLFTVRATFGLAIFTIVRDAVASSERSHLSAGTDAPLDWTDEQLARFKGIQAASWTASTSLFLAAAIAFVGFRGWAVVGQSEAELEATRARETETETETEVVPDDSVRSENPGKGGVFHGSETSERVKGAVVCLEE